MNEYQAALANLFEEQRQDFVRNPDYRGLDLDFRTFWVMKTGLSERLFNELNEFSIKMNNKII